jgi:hypothetical protein
MLITTDEVSFDLLADVAGQPVNTKPFGRICVYQCSSLLQKIFSQDT